MTQDGDPFANDGDRLLREQFRMKRLQVLNWGTFSDLHDVAIGDKGFLITGPSGSGKSTLLDALAALLVPPQWLDFNAAARQGEGGPRRDRNWVSYVRGAWADQRDRDIGEIATQYLRTGTTWSALAVTFANEEGKMVSLAQIHWLRGTSTRNQDVRHHFMVAERDFDIARDLEGFQLDIRAFKRRYPEIHHSETFSRYGERFRLLLGIESEMALKLLHKTQSAKNLGDLNHFMREFMLDRPGTFEAAERLVAEFADLDAAHREVITARDQIECLRPARVSHERLLVARDRANELNELIASIDRFKRQLETELWAQRMKGWEVEQQVLRSDESRFRDNLDNAKDTLALLEARHREEGGGEIESLERRIQEMEGKSKERADRLAQAQDACRRMGLALPDHAGGFAATVAEARDFVERWPDLQDETELRRDHVRDEKKKLENEFTDIRGEIAAMERQPSNVPAHMLNMRRRLAESLGLAEIDLPFVGELMQVKDDEEKWRGAIERVLRGFALSLLVDEQRYSAVSNYVNQTHLGQRLVYYRVEQQDPQDLERPDPASMVHKLNLKDTRFSSWLWAELLRRFDFACVDNLRDFRRARQALTREGQVRQSRERHEKDDRRRIDDPTFWVLGFDNREKLSLFKERARILAGQLTELDTQLRGLKEERDAQLERFEACHFLANLTWQDVDVASVLVHIDELQGQVKTLRSGNRLLQSLANQIREQTNAVKAADADLISIRVKLKSVEDKLSQGRGKLDSARRMVESEGELEPRIREELDKRLRAKGDLSAENLDDRHLAVDRDIRNELDAVRRSEGVERSAIERAFQCFKHAWPQVGADWEANHDSVSEFLALLQRLEWDGLPRYEQRFFELLKEQSAENLAALNSHISQSRKQIHERMDLVNEGLARAEFNAGTNLELVVQDRGLPEVREFRNQV